ncbi:hypothetical protein LTS18_010708 [Coniosporium uncinatum]|uniref:Uncharacterized protein n=1 Tax=Coniosporium uncinatum TaxID=93489 RepID=A0ACC3CZG7_9PEZI|nr:hypothetical protein LTS18_010708 [Coniosporium uncinatum]
MADSQLYNDNFVISSINAQKYDRVTRIFASSSDNSTQMSLDVNSELYPINTGENINMVLATTLNLDGRRDDERGWRDPALSQDQTLADMYDYVCHGKVYRFEEGEGENIKVFISFGGLLLFIEGPYKKLTPLRIDYVYLLLKR